MPHYVPDDECWMGDPASGEEPLKGLNMWVVSKDATTRVTDKMLEGTDAEYAATRVGVRVVRDWEPIRAPTKVVHVTLPKHGFHAWQRAVQAEIEKWKQDPGYIEVVPLPLPVEETDDNA